MVTDRQAPDRAVTAAPSVSAYNSDGVDLTLVRSMLRKTPTQRLEAVEDAIDLLASVRARLR